ncbi:MAG: Asp-tRNA(Asn)/Glu-tRNA(Gln) amidotransferase subunit GatC [Planctomycetes bacterium]|nr:Asp-tRNA(Asn)/Glu-tRNA(Gln) amidotransferase subunit GatC [Planctomycetota bacterium]
MKPEEFDALCRLSRLDLSQEERERLRGEFDSILKYVEALRAVPTEGVEPTAMGGTAAGGTAQVHGEARPLRADEPGGSLPRAEALRASARQDGIFFDVPRVGSA